MSLQACEAAMRAERINVLLDEGKRVIATTGPENAEIKLEIVESRPSGTEVHGKTTDGVWLQIFGYDGSDKVQTETARGEAKNPE